MEPEPIVRLRLYSRWQNSAGERVRIALNLKSLAYAYVPVGSLAPGDYARLNPQGLLPALAVEGRIIAQSTAILEYLEETHPTPPLLPRDPVLRAQARAFGQVIAADLHPINNNRVRRYLTTRLGAAEAEVAAWYRHWMDLALQALEASLAARAEPWPFCFGDVPGWADLHLVPQLANARRFNCDLVPYPRLTAVEARCVPLGAFQRASPAAQPDFPG
ncbi:maleylacetoacetate isomerase [Humitalea rosea]|uniref:Maleylacetoacetate isomerase n=1 Tax=Humitalea rosea TaxID=990373 RepID=A0A2W7ISB1_9PROT|nr:maleylacetoacetate isomerase [Humitalea rosea]PZW49150.1 maleylacetoacetate isomerase [Humitalea rosea]